MWRGASYSFRVAFSMPRGSNLAAISWGEAVKVVGPDGTLHPVQLTAVKQIRGATRVVAQYRMPAPGGSFDAADIGTYAVHLAGPLAVQPPPGGTRLGEFEVRTPRRRVAAPRTPGANLA